MNKEWVAILDFGSQYTQLIARRVRESQVYSKIIPYNISPAQLIKSRPKAIILSGGPATVTSLEGPRCEKGIFALGIPILGICYGMQLMAEMLGGRVSHSGEREYGRTGLFVERKDDLFKGLKKKLTVWMSHGDRVEKLPPGFEKIGHTVNSPIAVMRNKRGNHLKRKKLYGVQFHPEVVHTPQGQIILNNFLREIALCKEEWTIKSFIRNTVEKIKEKVKDEKILCAVSGGVDSTVLALILHKAVGKRLVPIFVNNGVLRKNEAEEVVKRFKNYGIDLDYVDAGDHFLKKLAGVIDPEEKRKIIGNEFIRIFERETKKLGRIKFLAQGTLYPDVIESRSAFGGPSAKIKTHHNVGGLPSKMQFALIEPFRELFKDEVREVGIELGLDEELIWRQPFPGPGLAVRIIGEVTEERLNLLREADLRVTEEIKRAGLEKKIWQAFAVLLPIKTVGVMGDERTYENVVAIRAVISRDGMTADWVRLPEKVLSNISNRIVNEVKGINRVVYDISSKPPSTIEWE
ncbi:MAG TPA: GMP synthase (glutamine-hydrolyzing) [Elusimicrobia bacterium]|jgi:GMP synthase (glutamine-hydrolysing)|nr:GMP synthase (glutamine-hydrolyzing) [Elusimicrobiota bacterium]